MLFMPLSVVALSRVQAGVAGVASSVLNTGQQVGGSMGLAVLGTVAWSAVANSIRSQAAAASGPGHPAHPAAGGISAAIYHHALATGFSRGFEVAGAILLLALVVAVSVIRVRRGDLSGTDEPVNI
jgi:NADH:ubiquinone oxidoreductase subunit 6 (subunit J)